MKDKIPSFPLPNEDEKIEQIRDELKEAQKENELLNMQLGELEDNLESFKTMLITILEMK